MLDAYFPKGNSAKGEFNLKMSLLAQAMHGVKFCLRQGLHEQVKIVLLVS